MISTGLVLFTYKATQFDLLGFLLLLFASMFSGIRWTCVQLLLQKSKMGMRNPVDMIYHMQPWMILSVLPFALWMEGMLAFR
jgi:solute carrier family 35 protein C2